MKKIIKAVFENFGYNICRKSTVDTEFVKIYDKFKEYTMVPECSYIENLKLCERYKNIKGAVVECGTWKGGMIAGMAEILKSERKYYLFDSFEGLPPAKEIDGKEAINWQNNIDSPGYYDNCRAEEEDAINAMNKTHVDFLIIKGWFENTLPEMKFTEPISFLRLDGDWYESIFICLQYLFPHVVKKGIIIIDDYYVWDGTSRAVHDYLSTIKSKSRIFNLHGGIAYIVKED